MPRIKKSKPRAICTVCGAYTDELAYMNSRCNKVVTGRRCTGVFRSGLGQIWIECETCNGRGRVGSVSCIECKGFGWKLLK
jgi:DnaJ-class molecular chaperone